MTIPAPVGMHPPARAVTYLEGLEVRFGSDDGAHRFAREDNQLVARRRDLVERGNRKRSRVRFESGPANRVASRNDFGQRWEPPDSDG